MDWRHKDQNKTSVLRIKHFMSSFVQEEKKKKEKIKQKKKKLKKKREAVIIAKPLQQRSYFPNI